MTSERYKIIIELMGDIVDRFDHYGTCPQLMNLSGCNCGLDALDNVIEELKSATD